MKKWLSNKRVRQPLFLFNYLLSKQILVTVLDNDTFVGIIHLATHDIVHRSIYVQYTDIQDTICQLHGDSTGCSQSAIGSGDGDSSRTFSNRCDNAFGNSSHLIVAATPSYRLIHSSLRQYGCCKGSSFFHVEGDFCFIKSN